MKVISIRQPWAQLIVTSHKQFETRNWTTKHRGDILIHASAGKMTKLEKKIYGEGICKFGVPCIAAEDWSYGAIIGIAKIVNMHPINQHFIVSPKEYHFGDYSLNEQRFAWEMSNPVLFQYPVPAKGTLGVWDYEISDYDLSRLVSGHQLPNF